MVHVEMSASSDIKSGGIGPAGDDHVVPFEVEGLEVRGRAVQLGKMVDQILKRHNYPDAVSRLLGEALVLTILLGSSLKFDGKFIVQSRTDGPVDLLVADFVTPGSVRGYARFDAERLQAAIADGKDSPEELLGKGVLALTIDQGAHMQRYQGIVELDGSTLEDVARTYFRQSEQIPTEVRLAVARSQQPGESSDMAQWRAGGILLQFLPRSAERSRMADLHGGDGDVSNDGNGHPSEDSWQEAMLLLGTVQDDELVDPTVGTERLLYRLFHEQGVRVYPNTQVVDDCSCSREKIEGVLKGFTAEEIQESVVDGVIAVDCEFCSTHYVFDPADFLPSKH